MEVAAWGLLVVGVLIMLSILSTAALESLDLPDLLGTCLILLDWSVLPSLFVASALTATL